AESVQDPEGAEERWRRVLLRGLQRDEKPQYVLSALNNIIGVLDELGRGALAAAYTRWLAELTVLAGDEGDHARLGSYKLDELMRSGDYRAAYDLCDVL